MSNYELLSEAETANREWHERCRDAVEEAEAQLLAAEAPHSWVDTGADGAEVDVDRAASAYALDVGVTADLLRPLDAKARGRIADDVVNSYLLEAGDEASGPVSGAAAWTPSGAAAANDAGRRRSWWRLPVTAVAAALLTFVYVDLRDTAGASTDALTGKVLLSESVRGGSERGDPSATMRIHKSDPFVKTHCWAEGRDVEIIRVVAKRSDGAGKSYNLASEVLEEAGDGALLKVTADLPPGSWSLSCEAEERTSGTRSWIGPAILEVDP